MVCFVNHEGYDIIPHILLRHNGTFYRVRRSYDHLCSRIERNSFQRTGALDVGEAAQLAADVSNLKSKLSCVNHDQHLGSGNCFINIGEGTKKEANRLSTSILSLHDQVATRPMIDNETKVNWAKM